MPDPDFCELRYYRSFEDLAGWREEISTVDWFMVGSYVPDGVAIGHFVHYGHAERYIFIAFGFVVRVYCLE